MKLEILPTALNDLYQTRLFYEEQASHLGEYFFNSIFADIESLTSYAGIHSKFFGFNRLLAKKFPFAVYYKTEKNKVLVYRVLDLRQNPESINKFLQKLQ